jgi:hypothetical protein
MRVMSTLPLPLTLLSSLRDEGSLEQVILGKTHPH